MRGGILYPLDIPLHLRQTLGYRKSERINTLVCDVIEASQGKGEICQSEEIARAMDELRDFLFQMVYCNQQAKGEESKAEGMLLRLFEAYEKEPDRLPEDFQEIRLREGVQRAVCDYIAGMTDSYAVAKYGELFVPKAWTVK